jgi:hypothetical protein
MTVRLHLLLDTTILLRRPTGCSIRYSHDWAGSIQGAITLMRDVDDFTRKQPAVLRGLSNQRVGWRSCRLQVSLARVVCNRLL